MFGPEHYVPVLKVKPAEKVALRLVDSPLKARMTPLLEIVGRKGKTVEKHLRTSFKGLADSMKTYAGCLLDVRAIAPDGPAVARKAFTMATDEGIVFTPVTGLTMRVDTEAALFVAKDGVVLRLTREEFEAGGLRNNLITFMKKNNLTPQKTDLVMDLGPIDEMVVEGVTALAEAFLQEVPDHGSWRTFTLSACSFPQTMGIVDRNSHGLVDRTEWIVWRDRVYARRAELARVPTFSDCAIQHPVVAEGVDFRFIPMSAAVRYTLDEQYLLIKGESNRIAPLKDQFPLLAKKLVYGLLCSSFSGASHCKGCESVKAAADGAEGFGSLAVWRRPGTIHHLTKVLEGIAALPAP